MTMNLARSSEGLSFQTKYIQALLCSDDNLKPGRFDRAAHHLHWYSLRCWYLSQKKSISPHIGASPKVLAVAVETENSIPGFEFEHPESDGTSNLECIGTASFLKAGVEIN